MNLLRTDDEIMDAYREAIRLRNISHQTVDAIAGWADGLCSKYMCGMKMLGQKNRELMHGALGVALVLVEDPEQAEKVRKRWVPRQKPPSKRQALASGFSSTAESEQNPATQGEIERKAKLKMWGQMGGKKGGKRRLKTMSKRARQRAASHAARARWAKTK